MDALGRLEANTPRQAEIVSLRYFGGLTITEVADILQLSTKTVSNEWRLARAWLFRELANNSGVRMNEDCPE